MGKVEFDNLGDRLLNDKVEKRSAYYQFEKQSLLHNATFLQGIRTFFGNEQAPNTVVDPHHSYHGVTTHENGKFLYQSTQANWALTWGYADFTVLSLWGCYLLLP